VRALEGGGSKASVSLKGGWRRKKEGETLGRGRRIGHDSAVFASVRPLPEKGQEGEKKKKRLGRNPPKEKRGRTVDRGKARKHCGRALAG